MIRDVNKVVLAYSGGLDTSVILKWLQETYGCEVVTFTADLGQGKELKPARAPADLPAQSDQRTVRRALRLSAGVLVTACNRRIKPPWTRRKPPAGLPPSSPPTWPATRA